MSNPKKTMDLQKLVQHPSSLKLLILHTPFPLEISTLWRCTNLIKLDLSKNNLETFPHIGNFTNLKFMFLHQNKLDHTILKGIFYSERQPTYSPLANSIVWVTFWGNKNPFFARHFLINQTSVLAVDNHMIVPEQRKQSVLESRIEPYCEQTDISYILENKQALSKTATQEEYMDQFWQEMRELRKKVQQICPIIKLQKLYRSWIVRKRIKNKKQQSAQNLRLKLTAFQGLKRQYLRQKTLHIFLSKRNKQHFLLPLRDMKLQNIKHTMLAWAARAKQRVLLRKLSLKKEVQFYQILRSNMLVFKSLYKELQVEKSQFLLIEAQAFKEIQQTVRKFILTLDGDDTFQIAPNNQFLFRQIIQGSIKKQYPRFLSINQRSYVIRLDYIKKSSTPTKSLLNESICSIPSFKTSLKPLFKNQNKPHFSTLQKNNMKKHMLQLQKRQQMVLEEFLMIKGSTRVLKDFVRCIFYLNSQVLKVNDTYYMSKSQKIQLFSQKSANKLASVTLIQKFWRGYIFRKKQKANAQLCAKQYRSVVKIQRWIKKLPQKRKYLFQNQILPLLKFINDPYFIVKMDDYLKVTQNIDNPNVNYLNRMKILEQNLVPYLNLENKKITLFWNPSEENPSGLNQKVKICFEKKILPFNSVFIKSVFKCQNPKDLFPWPEPTDPKTNFEIQRGDFSHLFHFNTITSLAQKDNTYWMKIFCNSVQEAKMRVLGILLKSYSFRDSFKLKIYGHEIVDFKKCLTKHILSNESIFITKGDVILKENSSKIQRFNFKSKIYLQDGQKKQKPTKLQQNMIIFAHNFKSENQSTLELQSSNSEPSLQALDKQKKMRKKAPLIVDEIHFMDQNSIYGSSTIHMEPRNITISQDQTMSQRRIMKEDLLPTALKRMMPLKKEIKSYKVEKKFKNKRQPSFILDNASRKQERIMTEPDLPIERSARQQKPQKSILEYSTVKQKIKRNYLNRKDLMKSNKEDFAFNQNFVNLSNFLQQQSLSEQRRRIKTELEISAYESADNIRVTLDKSADEMSRRKHEKMKRVENDIKAHKETLEKHRLQKEQMKEELQRIKSVSKQKRATNKQYARRLKVSFAEECFPIINRSSNSLRSQSESLNKQAYSSGTDNKFHIPTLK